jgi:hypothetical protein
MKIVNILMIMLKVQLEIGKLEPFFQVSNKMKSYQEK